MKHSTLSSNKFKYSDLIADKQAPSRSMALTVYICFTCIKLEILWWSHSQVWHQKSCYIVPFTRHTSCYTILLSFTPSFCNLHFPIVPSLSLSLTAYQTTSCVPIIVPPAHHTATIHTLLILKWEVSTVKAEFSRYRRHTRSGWRDGRRCPEWGNWTPQLVPACQPWNLYSFSWVSF